MISFYVQGTPIPQPRPQVSTQGGFARAFVPKKHPVHAWREAVRVGACGALAISWLSGRAPVAGPLALSVKLYLPRPKSHYGTGRNAAKVKRSAPALPAVRPDLDNYLKAIQDALDGVLWKDDGQVVQITAAKLYADGREPGATITVKQAGEVAA